MLKSSSSLKRQIYNENYWNKHESPVAFSRSFFVLNEYVCTRISEWVLTIYILCSQNNSTTQKKNRIEYEEEWREKKCVPADNDVM